VEGKLVTATIRSVTGTDCRVHYGEQATALHLKPGAAMRLNEKLK
jgi:hypothetical protein